MARTSSMEAVAKASTPQELRDLMWKSADKLRGSMDASQYMDFVLGLIFLKYVSDAFSARREALETELRAHGLLNDETPANEQAEMLDDRDRARTHLLGLFAAVGNEDPRVLKGRQSLANALF